MKKSSLKNYIAFLEAAAIANASSYWMRQHKLMGEALLKAKDEIAELKRRLDEASPTHQHNNAWRFVEGPQA